MKLHSKSAEETGRIGQLIGKNAKKGLVIAYYGDLGAGKTVMTKGIAEGLGITSMITSPTFTIRQSYEDGRLPLHHLDVYRIEDPDEMEEIGLDDCMDGEGVTVIEWAEQIEDLLPPDTVRITIERTWEDGREGRLITIEPDGLFPSLEE